MDFMTKMKQKENHIWALVFSILLCVGIGIFFDYYYALNDDMLIKDILAGIYTGSPEGRNIQMLYPLGWLISLFYRVFPSLPWYGIFICACHFGSIYLFTNRLLSFFHKTWTKVVAVVLEAGILVTLLLYELVFVQYTVTSALLAATAAFLFYTGETDGSAKDFFKKNMIVIVLVILAFQIRTEMLLLLFPLICVAGLCRWACETPFFTKENAKKYFSVFGGIMVGLALSYGINLAAYGSTEWKEFNRFFAERTDLYDFLWGFRPTYEENKEFYDSLGMTKASQNLIENYNFGFDEEIDADLLEKINANAGERKKEQTSFKAIMKQAVFTYKYRTFHETDYPWNLFVIVLYVTVFIAAMGNGHFRFLWELLCMGVVRTGLWMFILYRGRTPERITHPLYLMELCILTAFLLRECKKEGKGFTCLKAGFLGLLTLCSLYSIKGSVDKVRTEYELREEVNEEWNVLMSYIKDHPQNFYFLDVFPTVPYSEKLFANVDNSIANYDLMGGWASKSPLTEKKFDYFGINTMQEAVAEMDNVYIVNKHGEWSWLVSYYADKGIEVTLQKADGIQKGEQEVFQIYAVKEK